MSSSWVMPGPNQGDAQNLNRGIPLDNFGNRPEDARRFSSETQIRNGVRLSRNPDLGLRIDENIEANVYDCTICIDAIEGDNAMWDCKNCFQVFHHPCIREWASRGNFWGMGHWDCPTCKHKHNNLPESTCWCKSLPSVERQERHNLVRNSCLGRCGRPANACPHSHTCEKICHAGPCSICPRCPAVVPNPVRNPVPNPNSLLNLPDRLASLTGPVSHSTLAWLVTINIALIIWLCNYIDWVTQPYNNPKWIFGGVMGYHDLLLIFLLSPIIAGSTALAISLVNVPTTEPIVPGGPRQSHFGFFGSLWRFLFVAFIFIWPISSFAAGPGGVWYNNMKNSCDGFDTRVTLDGPSRVNVDDLSMSPNTTLSLHSPGEDPVFPALHIGTHITETNRSTDHYQFFFRISGSTPQTKHVSVDFDFDNRVWRMLHLSSSDLTNIWSAGNSSHGRTSPVYHHQKSIPSAMLVKNGTWSKPTTMYSSSLTIPELDLLIPHFWEFTQSCAYEPFLKVHRTSDKTTKEIQRLVNKQWDKKSESTVVMRTASFGHGQQVTDVCIKNGDWKQDGEMQAGLGDDMLVPLGLLASYRLKLYNENLRTFCFYGGGPASHQRILT